MPRRLAAFCSLLLHPLGVSLAALAIALSPAGKVDYTASVPADNPQAPEKIALGKTLFFDTRLSADNSTACATCHKPDLGFTDQLATSKGIATSMVSATPRPS
jgi:cytochrome c peroxidase